MDCGEKQLLLPGGVSADVAAVVIETVQHDEPLPRAAGSGLGGTGHRAAAAGNGPGNRSGGSAQKEAADRPPRKGQHHPRDSAGQKHRKNDDTQIIKPQVLL